jgi:UDP-N-acetylglucosamine:LPS N-acetylglucosamine transferase
MTLAEHDGAVLIEEKDLSGKVLAEKIVELKNNKSKLMNISVNAGKNAKTDALSEICRIITSL